MRVLLLLLLASTAALSEAPEKGIPSWQTEPDFVRAFHQADDLVSAHVREFPCSEFQIESPEWGERPGDDDAHVESVSVKPLWDPDAKRVAGWVAAVNARRGNADLYGSLRVYRRTERGAEFATSSDDTALVRLAHTEEGLSQFGWLAWSLCGHVGSLGEVSWPQKEGWLVDSAACWIWFGDGAHVDATVHWALKDWQLTPVSADYTPTPKAFTTDCRQWDTCEYRIRTYFRTDGGNIEVQRTESLTPWIEYVDDMLSTLLDPDKGKAPEGIVTEEQWKELRAFRPDWIEVTPDVYKADSEIYEVQVQMLRLTQGEEMEDAPGGVMHFRMREVDTWKHKWILDSFRFEEGRAMR